MRHRPLIFLVCLILTACDSAPKTAGKETPAIPVLAVLPTVKDVPVYVESIGTLAPSVFMEIRPQVSGPLTKVLVTEGQWVKRGTPMFTIFSKPYAIKVQEAEAQLAMHRAALESSQKKLQRYHDLANKDFISETEWDELKTEVAKGEASVEADNARLSAAALDLERCVVLSPVDGRVGKLDAHPGQLVAAGQPVALATVSRMDPLLIEFTVTEKELPQLQNSGSHSDGSIEIQPLCESEACAATAHITFMDNHFDAKTGLLLVRGKVTNPQMALRPGQSIRVRVPVAVKANAMLIPQKAIKQSQNGPYVYVVQADNTVGFRQVVLGDEYAHETIVLEGLAPTEAVITDGHLRLSPGLRVQVVINRTFGQRESSRG